jgi:hypothetical protein
MAGFVKRESAQRWNRAAGIVEAAGAGSRFVQQTYRPPQGGGGGAGINLVMVRVQENVDETMKQFDATLAKVMLGTGPALNDAMVIDNMDAGVPDEAAVGDITGPYPDYDDAAEGDQVFVLLKGMYVLAYQSADGRWNALQAGGGCVT